MPNGGPEEEAKIVAALSPEERLRLEKERIFLYPIEGKDLVEEIQRVEFGKLPEIMEEALAFREGLPFGLRDYDLNNPETLLDLQTRFISVEGATERPPPWYLDAAFRERVGKEVRDIKKKAQVENRALTKEEKGKVALLMRMENHWEGRKTIDLAFVQRMLACEEAETVAALLSRAPDYRPSVKPDKGHWQGALWGEFGEKVELVLREIVRMGMSKEELREVEKEPVKDIPDTIYATGFTDTKTFRLWLSHLLETAEGRMDVVWFAWKLALIWEIPAQLGCKVVWNEKEKRSEIKLADPPIGNDLHTWTTHLEEKRALEWGLDRVGGKRVRDSKYLTHTGYPLSLGKIGPLCQSYLHEAKIEFPPGSGKKVSLWELWWVKGMKIGGDFERDENILPWALTELQPRGLDTEELPPGSFGLWLLKRFRAFEVLRDIRSRPSLSDLANPDFFASRLRNWEKVLGVPGEDLPPEKNPRAWWVLSLLTAHHPKKPEAIPAVEGEKEERGYGTYFPGEHWSTVAKGYEQKERANISIFSILNHSLQCGFLRKNDIEWVCRKLGIVWRKLVSGTGPY